MWQRIQTVFLIVAVISLIISIFLPIWVFEDSAGQTHQLYPLHYTVKQGETVNTQYFPYSITAILAIAAVTIAIIEIGKYQNRLLQMKLGALNSLFIAGTIAAAMFLSQPLVKEFQGGRYGLALWLPGVAVVCNLLANRFIRRDEKLVRDSDRLR